VLSVFYKILFSPELLIFGIARKLRIPTFMKHFLSLSALIVLSLGTVFSQTHATDFTADDCDGNTHNLFSELDNGDVIVIAWVMPCFSCISGPLSAYFTAEAFEITHPGRVKFYVADDYGNTSCSSLQDWCNNNGMTDVPVFSDSSVDMSDYGTSGMPKVIVVGCTSHEIFFNSNFGVVGIKDAIEVALDSDCNADAVIELDEENCIENLNAELYPIPTASSFTLVYEVENADPLELVIRGLDGREVYKSTLHHNSTGPQEKHFNDLNLSLGTYLVTLSNSSTRTVLDLVILR